MTDLQEWLIWLENKKIERSRENSQISLKKILILFNLIDEAGNLITRINKKKNDFLQNIISITGTNGKGSCVSLLENIFYNAGYSVGTFTSPHLLRFNERISINKNYILDNDLIKFFRKIKKKCESLDIDLNYFQYSFVSALLYFSEKPPDVLILEIGIGGRSDSVNLINSDLAIITSVGLDHCNILGNSLEEIANEKAGIIKKNKYSVIGDEKILDLISDYKNITISKMSVINRDFLCKIGKKEILWSKIGGKKKIIIKSNNNNIVISNIAVAIMAVDIFIEHFNYKISYENISSGIENTTIMGRLQVIDYRNNLFLLDVCHNTNSTIHLINKIKELCKNNKFDEKIAIFSIKKTKDIKNFIKSFNNLFTYWIILDEEEKYFFSSNKIRSCLLDLKITHDKNIIELQNEQDVVGYLTNKFLDNNLIVTFGSFVVVAKVLTLLNNRFVTIVK